MASASAGPFGSSMSLLDVMSRGADVQLLVDDDSEEECGAAAAGASASASSSAAAAAAASAAAAAAAAAAARLTPLRISPHLLHHPLHPQRQDAQQQEERRTVLLPAHSQILAAWSGVLAHALEADDDEDLAPAGCCKGGDAADADADAKQQQDQQQQLKQRQRQRQRPPRVVPLPGTARSQWLAVAPFLYPALPPPVVGWSNLEPLLVLGAKYDMPALLARAAGFVRDNIGLLDLAQHGGRFVWKWLGLADAAGLDDVAAACAQRAVQLDRYACADEARLAGLSPRALARLVVCLASAPLPCTPRCSGGGGCCCGGGGGGCGGGITPAGAFGGGGGGRGRLSSSGGGSNGSNGGGGGNGNGVPAAPPSPRTRWLLDAP